jgi:hypothetical protein
VIGAVGHARISARKLLIIPFVVPFASEFRNISNTGDGKQTLDQSLKSRLGVFTPSRLHDRRFRSRSAAYGLACRLVLARPVVEDLP